MRARSSFPRACAMSAAVFPNLSFAESSHPFKTSSLTISADLAGP